MSPSLKSPKPWARQAAWVLWTPESGSSRTNTTKRCAEAQELCSSPSLSISVFLSLAELWLHKYFTGSCKKIIILFACSFCQSGIFLVQPFPAVPLSLPRGCSQMGWQVGKSGWCKGLFQLGEVGLHQLEQFQTQTEQPYPQGGAGKALTTSPWPEQCHRAAAFPRQGWGLV